MQLTPMQVLEMLRETEITLDGVPARATGINEGKFIVIATQRPVLGTLYASAEWHFQSAYNVLTKKKGAFQS